jgi:putative membrane protein
MRWNTTTFHGAPRRNTVLATLLIAAAVIAALASTATARPTATLDDAQIVAIFDLANTADIETGRLGAERAQSKEVRDYATMLHQVHTQVRQSGRDLAKKLGVTPVLPNDDKSAEAHAAVMSRLSKLQGAEFDEAFLEHERSFHVAVLDAVKTTLLPAIQNKELKDFVVSLAPAFEAHRLAAESLQTKLGAR